MKTRIFFLMICLIMFRERSWGQEEHKRFLIIEAGTGFISCDPPEKDYIRAVADQNYYDYYADNISAVSELFFAGLKYEYRVADNRLGLSAGLRYSRISSSIGRNGYASSGSYFYVKYLQNGTNTAYARVTDISQNGDFLGLPLELRFYPKRERRINIYYKLGGSFNLRFHSSTGISFYNDYMNRHKGEILNMVEGSYPWYSTLHIGAGIRTMNLSGVLISVECDAPLGFILPKGTYFSNPVIGGGFQVVCSVPLKRKENNEK